MDCAFGSDFHNTPLKAVLYVCWVLAGLLWGSICLLTVDKNLEWSEVETHSLSTVHYQNGFYFYNRKCLCVWLAIKSPQQKKVPGMVAVEKAVGH